MNVNCKIVLLLLFTYSNIHSHSSGSLLFWCSKDPTVDCIIGTCTPATKNTNNQCEGFLNLSASASDDLTPNDELLYSYTIDLYNNGVIDAEVSSLSKKQFTNGEKPTIKNPLAKDPNNPFDASGVYPLGIHKISWVVKDEDGNIGSCWKDFEIKDCKAPTPYCLTGNLSAPMPSTGFIDIWAKDLDRGSFDNCTTPEKLNFYFDGDTSKPSIRISCDDFVNAGACDQLMVDVQVWVEDEEGIRDYCTTSLIITDKQSICGCDLFPANLTIHVESITGEKVDCELTNRGIQETFKFKGDTTISGFSLGQQYSFSLIRNDHPLDGITTADIVKIQRHILGSQLFQNNAQLIAADVNATRTITAADLSEIRKLILGNIQGFIKNANSWVFVLKDSLSSSSSPFNIGRNHFNFMPVNQNTTLNIVAFKMGDVNFSAKVCD